MYIHADFCFRLYTASVPPEHKSAYTCTYMHSLVLECALETPKCACRNARSSAHDKVNTNVHTHTFWVYLLLCLNVVWSQEDGSGFSPEDGVIVEGSKLIIPNATFYHSNSVYLCTVSNIAGQAQANATILIRGKLFKSDIHGSLHFKMRSN